MALNLHGLRIFAAVVEARSFTRAAAGLYISQPAVSKAIQELERQLGLPLIERGSGSLQLTEAGHVMYRHARVIFAAERAAEEELAALRGLEQGTLHIGASTTVATYLLPAVLGAFRQRYPGIEVTLTSANTQEIAELLIDYRIDLAVVEGPIDDARIEVQPWRGDELVVIAAPTHPLAGSQPIPARALIDQPFIAREPGSGTRDVTETALRRQGIALHEVLELGSTEAIKQAVAAGLGIAIVSRAAIADQVALGKLSVLPVPDLIIHRQLYELRRVGRTVSAAVRAFGPFLRPDQDLPD